jgi:hypothetical protein
VPTFGGLITAGQPGIQYLRLSDATCGMKQPCVMDIKVLPALKGHLVCFATSLTHAVMHTQLGFTTSSAVLCGQQHASKCAVKDAATTTTALGFRLSGCQWGKRNVDAEDGTRVAMHRLSRAECKAVATADALATLFADFFTSSSDMQHAGVAAASRLHSARAQLACIHACVAACPGLRVFGCSALVVYDAAAAAHGDGNAGACVTVRLVDFAHAFFTDAAGPDGNLCAGLAALGAFLQERVAARLGCNAPQ